MLYRILKSFPGSPDGRYTVRYTAGDEDVELTDSLAGVALREGWVEPMDVAQPEKPAANPTSRRKGTTKKG